MLTLSSQDIDGIIIKAKKSFGNKYNCSQAVLTAFAPHLGLDPDLAARLATGFGLGQTQGLTCGLVGGGIMVISLRHGGGGPQGIEAKSLTYDLCRELITHTQTIHGSFLCRDLLQADPAIPADLTRAGRDNLFQNNCIPKFDSIIRKIAELAFGEL